MATYAIFDINVGIMSNYPTITAKTGGEAIKQYCKEKYPDCTYKRSASNYVQISTQECVKEGDRILFVRGKRQVWYELQPK